MNARRQFEPNSSDRKRLFILEKVKEEVDVLNRPTYVFYNDTYFEWIRDAQIDGLVQLKNLLTSLKQEGLIAKFNFLVESDYYEMKEDLKIELPGNFSELYTEYKGQFAEEIIAKGGQGDYLIEIDQEKMELSRNTESGKRLSYQFRLVGGKNKRFNYILKTIQEPQISGEKLSGRGNIQLVSDEISEINKGFTDKLKLAEKFITNQDNSGYQINPIYKIKFI